MDKDDAQAVLAGNFAPWVLALGLRVEAVGERQATLRLPHAPELERVGATVCGQALMAAADTAMVIAISAAFGGFRPMATVGQTISFFRPVSGRDALITARILKLGRSLVFGEIEILAEGAEEAAAHATTTYALAG
ncbi:MAG: PaaI family thioesterase [Rhodocyclaceae bacterium]|nr:PaaI family thioesterase [Rhodocyclaceae bacterium]